MATNAHEVGIKNSWSLATFRARFSGPVKRPSFVNKETGEVFHSLSFQDAEGATTLVGFSSNLGELTAQQVKEQLPTLRVVELESGKFKLCRENDTWEIVDI